MSNLPTTILGGDTFTECFRGLYDLNMYWRLTDPEYCVSVMRGAYESGVRAFDFSFDSVRKMFVTLRDSVDEEIVGIANPTWLQGCKLGTKDLQYLRSRVLKTYTEVSGFVSPEIAKMVKDELRTKVCMVFGYDPDAKPFTDKEINALYLDEDAYAARLDEVRDSKYVIIGGTDADWLFTLHREDIIARMGEIVRSRGQIPLLLCHYASTVLPKADAMNLDVDAYFAPINKSWAYFTLDDAKKACQNATKPVYAFMAFACGGLTGGMREAAEWVRDECGCKGLLYGTTKPQNAFSTGKMLLDVFGTQI